MKRYQTRIGISRMYCFKLRLISLALCFVSIPAFGSAIRERGAKPAFEFSFDPNLARLNAYIEFRLDFPGKTGSPGPSRHRRHFDWPSRRDSGGSLHLDPHLTAASDGFNPLSWTSGTDRTEAPPLGSFGKQILKNFKGLADEESLKPLAIGAAASLGSTFLDKRVQEYLGSQRRFRKLGEVGAFVGHSVTVGVFSGGMLLAAQAGDNVKLKSFSYSLAQGYLINSALTYGLKILVRRERPDRSSRTSFPSGHTSSMFVVASVFSSYYDKSTIPAYLVAGLVGASRLEKDKHYLSDVASGATLGYIVGKTVVRGTDTLQLEQKKSTPGQWAGKD